MQRNQIQQNTGSSIRRTSAANKREKSRPHGENIMKLQAKQENTRCLRQQRTTPGAKIKHNKNQGKKE